MFVDEPVDRLVGDEHQQIPDSGVGVRVIASCDLLDTVANISQEVLLKPLGLVIRVGRDEPLVVVERELYVHVQQLIVRKHEGEVRFGPAFERVLTAIVDVLLHPGGT